VKLGGSLVRGTPGRVHDRARGIDPRPVAPAELPGASTERRTFDTDVLDPAVIRAALLDACVVLGDRLRRRGQITGALTLHVSFADASTVVRTRQLPEPSGHTDDLRSGTYAMSAALGLQRARVRGSPSPPASSPRPVRRAGRSAWTAYARTGCGRNR
jgi:DNA polymerase IV